MSLLDKIALTHKEAGVERPDQTQLESDFSQMAFQFVQDRAADLSPYMLGFEVVERDDDGSKVCGVFGYKIGKAYYLVPVFFINGQIKGINSIYSKDTNSFSPLTQGYIDKLTSKDTIELGKQINRTDAYRRFENPSLDLFKTPYNKVAGVSEISEMWKSAAAEAFKIFDDEVAGREFANLLLTVKGAEFPEYDCETSPVRTLIKNLGPKANERLLHKCATDAGFASAVATIYGSPTALSVPMGEYSDKCAEFLPIAKKAEDKIKVVTEVSDAKGMSDDDKARLIRTGFTIKDDRKDEEVSKIYDVDFMKRITGASKPGKYSTLLRSGDFTETWILQPFGIDRRNEWLAVEPSKKFTYMARPSELLVDEGDPKENDIYAKAKGIDSAKVGNKYLFISEDGKYLGPVSIEAVISEPNERMRFKIYWHYVSKNCTSPSWEDNYPVPNVGSRAEAHHRRYLSLNPELSGQPTLMGEDTINMPAKGIKVLELPDCYSDEDRAGANTFEPGTLVAMKDVLYKAGACKVAAVCDYGMPNHFKIVRDSRFSSEAVSYKTACTALVCGFGLSFKDADDMLKEAREDNKAERLVHVKYAQQMPGNNMEQDVMMPQGVFPETTGADPYAETLLQSPMQSEVVGSQPNYLPPNDPYRKGHNDRNFDQGIDSLPRGEAPQPDVEAFQLAEQAAQNGQKTVFDHAGIAGLAKLYDINSVIDSYVPEMNKSLDRIGRMLFMFHWKNEDFAERFGIDSMPEMEDSLTSIYKSYGDLILKLRERSIDPKDTSTFN